MNYITDLEKFLEEAAERVNRPEFISSDPVQFPRRFEKLADIEIAALIASHIAWGNRTMICRNADRILSLMADDPAAFTLAGEFETLPDEMNLHRTFFARDLKYMLRGIRKVIKDYGSLDGFSASLKLKNVDQSPWILADSLAKLTAAENDGKTPSRSFPSDFSKTALKRFNMALRWLVRRDGIVDMGVWESLTPAGLYIPLDVHVGRVSRELGLLTRRSNDRKAVVELTDKLRKLRPDDPCYYDYALFGAGINGEVGNR